MLSLMIKDIYLLKRTMAFSVLYLVFMLFVFSSLDNAAGVFTFCMVAIIHMLMVSSCALDEKNKSDVILNSLPLSRQVIVGARYLMVIIYMLFAVAVYGLGTWVIGMLNMIPDLYYITLDGLIGAFLASSVITSIYLPFYFRLGYIKSRIYYFILFFGLFFGINLLVSKVITENTVLSRMGSFLAEQNDTVVGIITAGAAIAILAISYGISLRINKKREF